MIGSLFTLLVVLGRELVNSVCSSSLELELLSSYDSASASIDGINCFMFKLSFMLDSLLDLPLFDPF